MDRKHKQKAGEKLFVKLFKVLLTAALATLAVLTGIQAGNLLYKLDTNLVEHIDSESFKKTINISLPIIETVYNSGKASVSFSGEVKNIFRRIFEFDLDSPITILNAQSPLFMSYYNHEYKSMLAMEGDTSVTHEQNSQQSESKPIGSGIDEENGDTGTGTGESSDAGTGTGPEESGPNTGESGGKIGNPVDGSGNGSGTGQTNNGGASDDAGNTGDSGKANAGDAGKTGNTGNTDSDGDAGKPNNADKDNTGDAGEGSNTPKPANPAENGQIADLQPISSISYEAEEEEDEDNGDMVALDKMVIRNFTKHKIDIAKMLKEPIDFNFSKKGPKVLIYHTHTSESYVLKEEDLGKKGVASYNSNPKYNVVRVGEELAIRLRKYGIETLHNATVHDKSRPAAYGVAIDTLQSYLKSYPSIKVYIDIHRDGLDASKPKLRAVKKINGKNAAQIMFVMGTNDQLPNPHWEENLKFALKVQQKLNEKYPGLARPLWIVGKRYNQHVSDHAVLIEVGGDGNLLSECIESMKYLAEVLSEVMNEK